MLTTCCVRQRYCENPNSQTLPANLFVNSNKHYGKKNWDASSNAAEGEIMLVENIVCKYIRKLLRIEIDKYRLLENRDLKIFKSNSKLDSSQ